MKKSIAARTSAKRIIKNSLGLRAPRGMGWLTNPKKAAYNRIYYRTTKKAPGCVVIIMIPVALMITLKFLL